MIAFGTWITWSLEYLTETASVHKDTWIYQHSDLIGSAYKVPIAQGDFRYWLKYKQINNKQ